MMHPVHTFNVYRMPAGWSHEISRIACCYNIALPWRQANFCLRLERRGEMCGKEIDGVRVRRERSRWMPIMWISSTAHVDVLLICVPSHFSIAFFTFHPLSLSLPLSFFLHHCFLFCRQYCVKRCLILPQRTWPPFNLRLSIAGFNHGLGSINGGWWR